MERDPWFSFMQLVGWRDMPDQPNWSKGDPSTTQVGEIQRWQLAPATLALNLHWNFGMNDSEPHSAEPWRQPVQGQGPEEGPLWADSMDFGHKTSASSESDLSEKDSQYKTKRRFRFRWILLVTLVVASISAGGYFWTGRQVQHVFQSRLEAYFPDAVTIEHATLSSAGATAYGVKIYRDSSHRHILATVDSLTAHGTWSDLSAGNLKRLSVTGANVQVALDAEGKWPMGLAAGESAMVPLSLPWPVTIDQSQITVSQPGRSPWHWRDLQGTVQPEKTGDSPTDSKTMLALTAQSLDSQWSIAGALSGTEPLTIQSESWRVDSDRLSNLPLMPSGWQSSVRLQGTTAIEIQIQPTLSQFQALVQPDALTFQAPQLGVDLRIQKGDFRWKDQALTWSQSVAAMGGGQLTTDGELFWDGDQWRGQFQATTESVSLDSLRTLAHIPVEADGMANATGDGQFAVTDDGQFQLSLEVNGQVAQPTYDSIPLEKADVTLSIDDLILGGSSHETLQGKVQVETVANKVDLHQLFSSFHSLDQASDDWKTWFGGQADAEVDLTIPLATVSDMNTWLIIATARDGLVDLADQQLEDIQAKIRIQNGAVQVERLIGNGTHPYSLGMEDDGLHQVYVTGHWPLNVRPDSFQESSTSREDTVLKDPPPRPSTIPSPAIATEPHPQQEEPKPKPGAATFRIEGSQLSVRWLLSIASDYNVDLAVALAEWGSGDPGDYSQLDGHVTVNADLTIPTDAATDFSRWTVRCDILQGDLELPHVAVNQLQGRFRLEKGVVSIEDLTGRYQGDKQLAINATVPFDNRQAATIDADLPSLPVDFLLEIGRDLSPDVSRWLSQWEQKGDLPIEGRLALHLQLERKASAVDTGAVAALPSASLSAWSVNTQLESSDLTLKGKVVQNLKGQFQWNEDWVKVPELRLEFQDGATLKTQGQWPLRSAEAPDSEIGGLEAHWIDLPLNWLLDLVPDSRGTLGRVDKWTQQPWLTDPSESSESKQSIASGQVFSDAVGATRISGQLKLLPRTESEWGIEGQVSTKGLKWDWGRGTVRSSPLTATIHGDLKPGNWAASTFLAKVNSQQSEDAATAIQKIDGSVSLGNQSLAFDLVAQLLGGSVQGQGSILLAGPTSEAGPEMPAPIHFQFRKLQLNQVLGAWVGDPSTDWEALLDGQLDLDQASDQLVIDQGQMTITGTRWKKQSLSQQVEVDFQVLNDDLTISRFHGDAAGGQLGGKMRFSLSGTGAGDYNLFVRRLDISQLLRPLVREYPMLDEMNGRLTMQLRGTLGSRWDGNGYVALANAAAYGVKNAALKVPVRLELDPRHLAGKIEMRQSQFRAFNGAISGRASLGFGRRIDVDVKADLNRVDSDQLLSAWTGGADLGQGQIYGRLELKGQSVRSVRDLDGQFVGRMERTRSFQIPLLRNLAIFLDSGQLTNKAFDSDQVEMHLANGILKVDKMTFQSDSAQLLVTGNVTSEGRMDLEVAARIANLRGNQQLYEHVAGRSLTALASPTTAAVTQVTDFLSNRVVYLNVGGTVRSPQYRLQTGRLIKDQLVRQFLAMDQAGIVPNLTSTR